MKKMIYNENKNSGCFFRSTVEPPYLKVLLQITERCNMSCIHCFNSSNSYGDDIKFEDIKDKIIPQLKKAKVVRVTLTGGEPMVHPEIFKIIKLFNEHHIHITLCTNGLLFNKEKIDKLFDLGNVHINVSLDGNSYNSHGIFRGINNIESYNKIINNIIYMGEKKLLNGILCSPNTFSNDEEYIELCNFAKKNNAKYILFNPLSKFGRGNESQNYSYKQNDLLQLRKKIENLNIQDDNFSVVFIRIFNHLIGKKDKSLCGYEIPYIFVDGSVAVCPYMIFATASESSKYSKEMFIYGNILDENFSLLDGMKNYELLQSCECCNRGCIASKITYGLKLEDFDPELYS